MDKDRSYEIENSIDTQDILEDTELTIDKLIKKKMIWTGIAVFWFIVWLLIIMYMFFGNRSHRDTIKPPESTPVTTADLKQEITLEPTSKVGSISVKEYIIKFDKLSPKYTGKLYVETNNIGDVYAEYKGVNAWYKGINIDAVESYGKECHITYKIEEGNDNFTAERTDESKLFTSSDKLFKSFTGTTTVIVDSCSTPELSMKKSEKWIGHKGLWIVVERDRPEFPDPKAIKGVGVIVSDEVSISDGVSALEKEINSLKDNGQSTRYENLYTVDGLSLQEYADLVGKCFNTKGYIISSTDEGEVQFQKTSDGGVSIKADNLKEGDTLVFFSLDRVFFTHRTAAIYSKILQNDYSEILEVYEKEK